MMTKVKLPHRRQFLRLAAGVAALPSLPHIARAQSYPSRPVRIVVGFPPGGVTDLYARLIGQWLSERLGQPFVIDNRPGASNNIATEAVARAPADGYTLLMLNPTNAINATFYEGLNYNFIRDIAPVASLARSPMVMEVNPLVPAKSVSEVIAYAKANPRKLNMGSAGVGSPLHVAGELFKMMAGIDMIHVPYRGSGPLLTDLLGGQVQVAFDPISSSIGYIRAGKLRALAVTAAARADVLPEIPSVNEFIPGYEAMDWSGVGVPKGTSDAIVAKLNAEINAALVDPKVVARLADLGSTPVPISSADFEKFIVEETEKWGKVVKFAGIKAE